MLHIFSRGGILVNRKIIIDRLLSPKYGMETLREFELTGASEISVRSCLELLWRVEEGKRKGRIRKEILLAGEPLKDRVKLLMTIKGIAPLVALAFLADIGDIERFPTLRKMNAYPGLVPRVKESGGKSKPGQHYPRIEEINPKPS